MAKWPLSWELRVKPSTQAEDQKQGQAQGTYQQLAVIKYGILNLINSWSFRQTSGWCSFHIVQKKNSSCTMPLDTLNVIFNLLIERMLLVALIVLSQLPSQTVILSKAELGHIVKLQDCLYLSKGWTKCRSSPVYDRVLFLWTVCNLDGTQVRSVSSRQCI